MQVRAVAAAVVLGSMITMLGCAPTTTSTTVATTPSVSMSIPETTTSTPDPDYGGALGIYPVDPRTLEPLPGSVALTTADSMWGEASPNGRWVAVQVRLNTTPETDLVRLIDVGAGEVVAETKALPQYGLTVDDAGTVYRLAGTNRHWVEVLTPGDERFSRLADLPVGFGPWSETQVLDDGRLGWFGTIHIPPDEYLATITVADPSSGVVATHPVPGVRLSGEDSFDVGDWSVGEGLVPAVVWDEARSRVLVVHADEPVVTALDLDTGTMTRHTWSEPTTWLHRLAASWNPVAHAKGPSTGTNRSAVLTPDGETLFVATEVGEFVRSSEDDWSVEWTPRGVVAIDTTTWRVLDRWDEPIAILAMSPGGEYVVGTGLTRIDTLSSTGVGPHPISIISTSDMTLTTDLGVDSGEYDTISFSADGSYAYITRWGGATRVLDLVTGKSSTGPGASVVFGEAGLVVTSRYAGS